jgi:hypothetical protein
MERALPDVQFDEGLACRRLAPGADGLPRQAAIPALIHRQTTVETQMKPKAPATQSLRCWAEARKIFCSAVPGLAVMEAWYNKLMLYANSILLRRLMGL